MRRRRPLALKMGAGPEKLQKARKQTPPQTLRTTVALPTP